MNNALIIVDAWDYFDEKKDPWADREAKSFSRFLNTVCNYERSRGTKIYHEPSGHDIMSQFVLASNDTVLDDIINIPKNHDNYYFAGFHTEICVSGKADQLSNYISKKQIAIAINLSLLSFESENAPKSFENINHNFCWWTRNGFSNITL